MIVFLIFILIFEVLILALIDKKLYKSYLTPFTILSIPYVLIILLTLFAGPKLGFKSLYPQSLYFWIFGLLVFWLPGVLIRWLILKNGIYFDKNISTIFSSKYFENSKRWIIFLAWITLIISASGLLISINKFGIANLGEEAFTRFYGSGITGHALAFNTIPFIFLMGIVKRTNKFIIITLVLIFISFFVYQVKTWVMIPMISGFLLRYYLGNLKLTFINLGYIIALFTTIFFTIYFFSIGPNLEYLRKAIFEYLFAGTLGLSEHLKNNIDNQHDPYFLINPLKNIYNFLTTNDINGVVQKTYVNILSGNQISTTNVRTIFGTIYLNSSLLGGTLFLICLSIIIHFLFSVFLYSHNIWIIVLTTFFLGGLAMGWFDMWFNQLNYYEISTYILILMVITKISFPKIIFPKITYKK